MKTFKQFLNEGVSPILYHVTSLTKLVSILNDDKFNLTVDIGGQGADRFNKGKKFKPYYLATSRVKFGGYNRSFNEKSSLVNLVLDGVKLSHNLSGSPVDYWGADWRTNPEFPADQRLRSNENEDRLFSAEGTIDNFHKYIKEIHIMLDKYQVMMNDDYDAFQKLSSGDQDRAFRFNDFIRKVNSFVSVYHIPVYVYNDPDAFKTLNKTKSNSASRPRFNDIENVVELFDADDQGELSEGADKIRYSILYHSDFEISLNSTIHNVTKSGDDPMKRSLEKLVKRMHKYKLRSTKDIITYLDTKWRKQ